MREFLFSNCIFPTEPNWFFFSSSSHQEGRFYTCTTSIWMRSSRIASFLLEKKEKAVSYTKTNTPLPALSPSLRSNQKSHARFRFTSCQVSYLPSHHCLIASTINSLSLLPLTVYLDESLSKIKVTLSLSLSHSKHSM